VALAQPTIVPVLTTFVTTSSWAPSRAWLRMAGTKFRPYNWETGKTEDADRVVRADGPVIVEGVSALHPDLAPLYGLRIWVESDAATVLAASVARGVGDWMRQWEEMFLPSVRLYLETDPRARADVLAAGRGFARLSC
jgi:uridine kinase